MDEAHFRFDFRFQISLRARNILSIRVFDPRVIQIGERLEIFLSSDRTARDRPCKRYRRLSIPIIRLNFEEEDRDY